MLVIWKNILLALEKLPGSYQRFAEMKQAYIASFLEAQQRHCPERMW
jgi:hypothetical protein